MASNFAGMLGRTLSRQLTKDAVQRNAAAVTSGNVRAAIANGGHSGKYLFVAHPNCCERCKLLGMNPHFFNTPDVAFITHPNCLCATIEAPDGLSPEELMEWAKNPVGQLRFGWNYGQSFAPVNITQRNRENRFLAWQNRVRPIESLGRKVRRQRRVTASEDQIRKIRRAVKRGTLGPAEDLTDSINAQIEAQRIARHNKAVQENARNLRKGSTWNPNGKRNAPKRKQAPAETSVQKMQRLFRGNTTVVPQNNRGTATMPKRKNFVTGGVAGSGIARKRFNEEQKRKRRIEKLMKKLGI